MSVCNCMLFVFGPSKSLNQIVFSFFHNSCWVFKGSVSCPLKKMSLCKWSQSELGKVERSKCPWDTFSCHLSIMFQRTYLKSRQRCQMLSNEILRRIAAGRLRLDSWRWLLTIDWTYNGQNYIKLWFCFMVFLYMKCGNFHVSSH